MSIFSWLFGSKKEPAKTSKPAIYGGDGLSGHTPAIVNCASMGMAQAIIDSFISKTCRSDWEREIEYTIKDPADPNKSLRMITVKTTDGEGHTFYFDLSRPVGVAMKMFSQ